LLIWVGAALAASTLFAGVLEWERSSAQNRWSSFLVGDPRIGARLFREKGCAHCHSVNGVGGKLAPALGYQQPPPPGLNELVTAMWNHAPRMWARIRQENVPYPDLSYEDMAHLFAFLYASRYVDAPGDAERGRQLFETKGCIHCHSFYGSGGKVGPDLSTVGLDTPIAWAQTMWNHAPTMHAKARELGVAWPEFEGNEMNDLLAYIREMCGGPRHESELLPADPDRGWQLFQSKSCIVCHAVKGEGGHLGPELSPRHDFAPTLIQFAGLMWNHSPQMWREMQARKISRPTFTGREMADVVAFLHSVGYFEPGGSPKTGEMLFERRGCSNCHGAHAQGTQLAPALRGQGRIFTSVTLATALWQHGPKMYRRAQQLGLPWPQLQDSDVGDLLVFLNTAPAERERRSATRASKK
jgi:cytochrome c2